MEIPFSIRYNNIKLKVERLYKTSDQPGKSLFPGIEDLSFNLKGGECVHLKSPGPWVNTLLLNALAGRTRIDAGAIWVEHQRQWLNLPQLSARQMGQIQTQTIGYFPRSETLKSHLSVLDCILAKFLDLEFSRADADRQCRRVLDWLGISRRLWDKPLADLPMTTLHQVNLACTFAVDYAIIVFEPPISQLDQANQALLLELIGYRKEKGTCFIGRFDQAEVRGRVCDRNLCIQVPTPTSVVPSTRTPAKAPTLIPIGIPTDVAVSSKAAHSY
ncbi:MAG: hypothetical protein KTR27_04340 [Leptolyngbyaceae cyanobacterium MAG.088]|nr:hypothetical protein [Leptolyngbyaceae cyanobacterium MAG.088]